jgi:hypothetical protein
MSSGSILDCCKGLSSVSKDSEGYYSSAFRKHAIVPKKPKSLHSPKASLKSLPRVNSNKHLEDTNKETQENLTASEGSAKPLPLTPPLIIKSGSMKVIGSEELRRQR